MPSDKRRECRFCGTEFPPPENERGRKLYCSRSCRQRNYEREHGLKMGTNEPKDDEVRYLGPGDV